MPNVGPRKTARTNRRLARVRLARPGALAGVQADNKYTPREVRRVRTVDKRVRARQAAKKDAARRAAPQPYNPLAPLSGPREQQELDAATKLRYGDEERALRNSTASREADVGRADQYYEDYRQKLREATARVNETNRQNITAQEGRVDTSYAQDKAGVEARNAQASETAAKLGRGPVQSEEGSRAVEAQRTAGNADLATMRAQSGAQEKELELRGATASLAKAKAVEGAQGRVKAAQGDQRKLAADKGAFQVKQRADTRQSEREWSAIQKEFGLKQQDLNQKGKTSRADRKLEAQKLATQKIVARIYGSADKAGAAAQIRVAKLQLEKGKIDQSQYRYIVNEYKGLPAKGKPGQPKGSKPGSTGNGSGPGGSLAPWERDKVSKAVSILNSKSPSRTERSKYMQLMQQADIPARLARKAWARYVKSLDKQVNRPGGTGDTTKP